MENSFLKDAINRIVELATPFTLETRDGHQFCSADLVEVKPEVEFPARYSVDTLEALVKLIRTEGINHSPLLYVRGTAPGGSWWTLHTRIKNTQSSAACRCMRP